MHLIGKSRIFLLFPLNSLIISTTLKSLNSIKYLRQIHLENLLLSTIWAMWT